MRAGNNNNISFAWLDFYLRMLLRIVIKPCIRKTKRTKPPKAVGTQPV